MIHVPRETWRRQPLQEDDGSRLLASNVAVLEAVGGGLVPPTLRWYRYRRPCVVLGYGQKLAAVDLDACAVRGITVLRRPAGGAAVLADSGLLGMAVALPLSHPLVPPDLTRSYRWLGETLASALGSLGLPTRLVPIEEARQDVQSARQGCSDADRARALACFGTFSPFEVAVGDRKLVGLAQVRRRGAALFQVGILLRSATGLLAQVLACSDTERAALARALDERTLDVQTALGYAIEPQEVVRAVETALIERHGVRLLDQPLTPEEEAAAREALPNLVHFSASAHPLAAPGASGDRLLQRVGDHHPDGE